MRKDNTERRKWISKLDGNLNAALYNYNYKLARYFNDLSINLITTNNDVASFYLDNQFDYRQDIDLIKSPATNVCKSVIDSLVSKLSNQKVRPYFTPINGTYKTRKLVQQAQEYFDTLYDNIDLHSTISDAFRNACIFGVGYVFLNPYTNEIKALQPWCVATLNSEKNYGKQTKMLIKYRGFPKSNIKAYGLDNNVNNIPDYFDFAMYIDIMSKEATIFINGKEVKTITYNNDELPIAYVYFNKPIYGNLTTSVIDELDGIQNMVDYINSKISAQVQLSPGLMTFVSTGSSFRAQDISNKVGVIYEIEPSPDITTMPVTSVPMPNVDMELLNLQDSLVKQAYEMVGISQLSAMSKKPTGLNSGTALQTMEDVESDRFETQITRYINSYIDVTKMIIKCLPDDIQIVSNEFNGSYKWKDIKEQSEMFKIQYSAASSMSKDPQTKLQQIMQMSQLGLIPPSKIAQLIDMPDLNDAYKGAQAVQDAVDNVIQRCLEHDEYVIPQYVSYQLLSTEIVQQQNIYYGSLTGDKHIDKDIYECLDKLERLDNMLTDIMTEEGFIDISPVEATITEDGMAINNANMQAASSADVMTDTGATEEMMNA